MIELPFALRPVSGISDIDLERYINAFRSAAVEKDLTKSQKKSLRLSAYAGRVTMLSAGHLQHFLRQHGIGSEQADGENLADHLEDTLPQQFDDEIIKPALPSKIYAASTSKRILIVGSCPELAEDRQIIREVVASFYGVKNKPENWPPNRIPNGYELVSTSHKSSDDVIELAQTTLGRQAIFDSTIIAYHPLSIDMVSVNDFS